MIDTAASITPRRRVMIALRACGHQVMIALRRVQSYDTLRVVMMCIHTAQLWKHGDHIITLWLAKAHKFSDANS